MFGLMTIKQVAEELSKPISTIYSWKDSGAIPLTCFKQIGGTWFIRVEEFQKWINA